ncbi:tetratricopeptide repeat protein [Qipengyuania sp. NPDC077563]|uniref:tetratricopeptide repeat protein n=1 Tax=Qipengyuania sp. NPDC077563 TaxID=3364497 RepID=UPI00384A78E1
MAPRPVISSPQDVITAAQDAAGRGDNARASAILQAGLSKYPKDLSLLGKAASLALSRQNNDQAVDLYRQAIALAPDSDDLKLDLVIALTAAGRPAAALELALGLEAPMQDQPRYWSSRANAARQAGNMEEAASSYDRCLLLKSDHPRALHGRARVALVRGEENALPQFDRALSILPSEADLWLGRAQALDAAGRAEEARALAAQLVDKAPQWIDALDLYAQLLSATGESEIDAHYSEAARRMPSLAAIPAAHIRHLTRREKHESAYAIAEDAKSRFAGERIFELACASSAGMAGKLDLADELFDRIDWDSPDLSLELGRHRLRRGDLEEAERLLDIAAADKTTAHTAYALRGILWRLTGDERAVWLHEQAGLIRMLPLPDAENVFSSVIPTLLALHDGSSFPVGQSLRGGTQTRHILFQRQELELELLKSAVEQALEIYRSGLPDHDPAHPLLAHKKDRWSLLGSWSVRLKGGDHHAAHIHPQGVISSALYMIIPESVADDAGGKLELGRPPTDLMLDLEPLCVLQPRLGYLALFPSTLYHGTTCFTGGIRMTVAFDVAPRIVRTYE